MSLQPARRAVGRRAAAMVALAFCLALGAATAGCNARATTVQGAKQPPAAQPQLFVSLSGSDANPCSQAAPCASFARAYQAAPCGAVVEVAAGSYPSQRIAYDPAKEACTSASRVVFEPSGGPVATASLDLGASGTNGPKHILVRNMASTGFVQVWPASDDIVLQNLTAMTANVFGASDVTVRGGVFGPCSADASHPSCVFKIGDDVGAGGVRYNPSNVTLDGVTIHDFTTTDPVRYHIECLFIVAGGPITIRNSRIYRCQTFGLFVQDYTSGRPGNAPPHDVTLVDNWWGSTYNDEALTQVRNTAIELDPRGNVFPNWTLAFNSFYVSRTPAATGSVIDVNPANTPGLVLKGNLMMNRLCIPGATYSYNVLVAFSPIPSANAPCGRGDRVEPYNRGDFGYANPADLPAGDWHLAAGSPTLGLVPSSAGCPATDIDGRPRPAGEPCDAGADQRRDTPACLRQGTKKKPRYKQIWVNLPALQQTDHPRIRTGLCPKPRRRP